MAAPSGNAPAWLFAFVDLAFLMLLGMTQLASNPNAPELGEMPVPRIGGELPTDLPSAAGDLWQLRVHPRAFAQDDPFELVSQQAGGDRMDAASLRARLAALHDVRAGKPLLAPHADSRSEDFLEAVDLVEEVWPSRRRATVERVFSGR